MTESGKVEVLPAEPGDQRAQRCVVGVDRSPVLGTAAWVTPGTSPGRQLVRLWPSQDVIRQPHVIRASDLVSGNQPHHNDSPAALDLIPEVGDISSVEVTVVWDYYKRGKQYKAKVPEICQMAKFILHNLVLTEQCLVRCSGTGLGELLGVAYIVVNKLSVLKSKSKFGRVKPNTQSIVDRTLSRERYEQQVSSSQHNMVLGGLDRELANLTEIVELPLSLAAKSSRPPPRGVLLYGPPGCGKTTLVNLVARQTRACLLTLQGSDVISSRPGETEQNLRECFAQADALCEEGPCILLLEDVDVLCPRHSSERSSADQRLTSQLLRLLDNHCRNRALTVIGTSSRPDHVDVALRSPGRLEKDLGITVPSLRQRERILDTLTRTLCLAEDVNLTFIAEATPGFVGADLKSLVQHAQFTCLQRHSDCQEEPPCVNHADFSSALHSITPSTQRGAEITVDHKPAEWSEIGGLDEVKAKLKQAVEWPLKYPETFVRLGIPTPKGVLLYGPPGCAKTTLVRAIATACNVNFLSINAGQLYSPYVGDSERKLSQVFQQARAGAPSILFIDELDSVFGNRSKSTAGGGVQGRVLSTLLNEMDGIGRKVTQTQDRIPEGHEKPGTGVAVESVSEVENAGVLVVAATNRPEMLDDAVLRPGRIDRLVFVGPPDKESRRHILRIHARKMAIKESDLCQLAELTEGFTGADLENMCREAALLALSTEGLDSPKVGLNYFQQVLRTSRPSVSSFQVIHPNN